MSDPNAGLQEDISGVVEDMILEQHLFFTVFIRKIQPNLHLFICHCCQKNGFEKSKTINQFLVNLGKSNQNVY